MKNNKKIISGLTGATMLLSGVAATAETVELNGYTLTANENEAVAFTAVANVQGDFKFDQNVISPSDEAFNILGTTLTGACAKPAFAFEAGNEEGGTHYINVSGSMKESYTVTLEDLKSKEENKIMSCSCATGVATINAEVGGIPLSGILELADLAEGANTLTVTGSDGFKSVLPLSYALDHEAMLVYKINGENLPEYIETQMWMPGTVAQYFTRSVVSIEVTAEENVPEVKEAAPEFRNHIAIVNKADEANFPVGQAIVFQGYADDYDKAIAAIEFSMDGGETWTKYETKDTTTDKWVYWFFTYTPEAAGTYKLMVRAVNEDGNVSPLASTLYFEAK